MNTLGYLLLALGLMIGMYGIYRHTFLKKPKDTSLGKPHYTLKIESE